MGYPKYKRNWVGERMVRVGTCMYKPVYEKESTIEARAERARHEIELHEEWKQGPKMWFEMSKKEKISRILSIVTAFLIAIIICWAHWN